MYGFGAGIGGSRENSLIERIDSRHGMHTLEYGEKLGIGSQKYELVKLDK